jgi:hypothetical protein
MKRKIFAKKAKTQSKANVFPEKLSIPGKLYPPRNKMEITAAEMNIAVYSENKNNPNFIELYSV